MIKVYDDFFPEEIREEVHARLMEPHWHLKGGTQQNPFWHYDELEKQEYFNDFLYKKICDKLGRTFKSVERIYANGQTACQCGNPHMDDGDLTFLYYPAPFWDVRWQGHLIFLLGEEGKEDERIVLHRSNRAVLFDAKQWHYADAPERGYSGLRISLAYKLWI
tara:strand:+ start:64 stop:552 length:489 start_codon:yes stop_codon:yes gene_type:complete